MPNGEVLLDSAFKVADNLADSGDPAPDLSAVACQPPVLNDHHSHEKSTEGRVTEAEWLDSNHLSVQTAKVDDQKTIEAAKTQINLAMLRRKGQFQLRQRLLHLYQHKCAISGCTIESVLEVAYILPYVGSETHQPSNSILLRSDLHILFDLHLLTIHPETMAVMIAPDIQNGGYKDVAGKVLHLPDDPSAQPDGSLLSQHFQQCGWLESAMWTETYSL